MQVATLPINSFTQFPPHRRFENIYFSFKLSILLGGRAIKYGKPNRMFYSSKNRSFGGHRRFSDGTIITLELLNFFNLSRYSNY